MKWGKNSKQVGDKLTQLVGKVFGAKGLSVLVSVSLFALLVSAMHKWGL